ncbi:MAG: cysteine desulfurase [Alphaproteobacteria bacterium]|nr:cysteine desulfurase [Alphaproteobacteria bacterium]
MTSQDATDVVPSYDVDAVRSDFPILSTTMHDKPLVFLDSAASAQKPRQVIDAVSSAYESEYANVHRGLYKISETATANYEGTRETIRKYINAERTSEIIFTRNATESINLVAYSFGREFLEEGDEVVITELEHHANIVPWQILRDEKGVVLRVAPVNDDGELIMSDFEEILGPNTKLVTVSHMSNVMGTVLPVEELIQRAHAVGAKVLLHGCQSVTHIPVDVQALGCDFYVFSGHKLYGPSGIGVLYGREELLDSMPPFMGGGDMISSVTFAKSTWANLPHKFEAGTPAIVQAIGLGAAIDYVTDLGLEAIGAHEAELLNYATQKLSSFDGLKIIGTAPNKASVLSFTLDFAHPHDIATIIDRAGVAVRAGHHCAQPLMDRMDVPATVRASIGLYNNRSDIDALAAALADVQELFG